MAMVISEGRAEIGRLAETYLSEKRFDDACAE